MDKMSQILETGDIYAEIGSPPMIKERFHVENECYGSSKIAPPKKCYNSLQVAPQKKQDKNGTIALIVTIVVVVMLIIAVAACCIAFALEISELKSKTFPAEQQQSLSTTADRLDNLSSSVDTLFQLFQLSAIEQQQSLSTTGDRLKSFNSSLNMFFQQLLQDYSAIDNRTQQLNISLYQPVNDLQIRLQDIINALQTPGQYPTFPASSCATLPPSTPSGYYWVRASNGSAVRVYCDMTRSCGGVTGGWTRVVELDTTDSSHQCPSGLRQQTDSNIRTCVKDSNPAGCSSIHLTDIDIPYSKVCGRIIAYQFGSTNAFFSRLDINSHYVDGVSLTHGDPRQHIWTFAAARNEAGDLSSCPCQPDSTAVSPSFVGDDYFCDTGFRDRFQLFFNYADPLWDGAGCGPTTTCCSFNTPPWFYKQLPQPTTDSIEMRVCRSNISGLEDIALEIVNLFIQ